MRSGVIVALIGIFISTSAIAQETFVKGNDTGGIISWSCEAEAAAREIAAEHCARFDKYHRITSVHRRYGDYITFQCLWNPNIARFQVPAVGARTVCMARAYGNPAVRTLY